MSVLLLVCIASSGFSQENIQTTFFKTTPEVEQELRNYYGSNTTAIKQILMDIRYMEKEENKIAISSEQYKAVLDRFSKTDYTSESHRQKELVNKEKAFKKYVSAGQLIETYNSKLK